MTSTATPNNNFTNVKLDKFPAGFLGLWSRYPAHLSSPDTA
jgi:hypothetical protein